MDIITALGYVWLIAGIIVESIFLFIAGIISLIASMALLTISRIPDNSDYEAAQRVADALQSCVEVADGDSEIFTRELMRITNDVAPQTNINPKIRR